MRSIAFLKALSASLVLSEQVRGAFVSSRNIPLSSRRAPQGFHVAAKTGDSSKDDGFVPDEELLFPKEESASSSSGVDWDAEWKKVVEQQKDGSFTASKAEKRPGEGYYKTEAEIAAIKAANKATAKINEVQANIPSMPSFDSLKGDWKFWIGLLLVLSFGSSLLAATSGPVMYDQAPPPPSGGSYYI